MKLKKLLVAGGLIAVLGVGAVGVSVVQAQSTPTPTTQQNRGQAYLSALANRLHVSVDQLKQAMSDARKDAGIPDRTARPARPAAPGAPGAPGAPAGGPGFGFGRGPMGGFLGAEADAVAGLFKETRQQLVAELPGKTLAEVASAHGVSTQDVVNTIVTTANQKVDQMAQARGVSADRVNQIKQQISERAQQFVTTHRFPARGSGTRS